MEKTRMTENERPPSRTSTGEIPFESDVPSRSNDSEKYQTYQDLHTLDNGSTTRANSPLTVRSENATETHCDESSSGTLPTSTGISFGTTLCIVIALMVNQFLATSDATIVSTSLPTIVAELHGTQNEYAWVPVAYLLTQTACQPLYGKLADVFGRRPVIYASTITFLIGSALCGAAQSMRWLIIARGLSGIGGGGIVNSVWVLTTEIVPPGTQAKWSQALSVTWSASAVAGPMLGGLFTGSVSWRWAFYINLPIGIAALIVVWYFLRKIHLVRRLPDGSEDTRSTGEALRHAIRTFDYVGLFLLMGGTSALVIGFSFAGYNSWTSPRTLGLLVCGGASLLLAGVYETVFQRNQNALIPAGVFTNLTVVTILIISILHNFAFTAGTYYIPLYYQALHGTSPLVAGMQVLPFSLGAALITIPTAWFISWREGQQWIDKTLKISIALGLTFSTVGYGLMITLNERSGIAIQEVYPLIAGVGIGMLFHTPFQVVTNSLPRWDLAQATGAFFLVRFIGTTTGLSVAGAIFDSNWLARKPDGFVPPTPNPLSIDLRSLVRIEPIDLRQQVLSAVSSSVSSVWIVCTPCLGVALMLSLLLRVRHHPSHSQNVVVHRRPSDDDIEKATPTTLTPAEKTDLDADSITSISTSITSLPRSKPHSFKTAMHFTLPVVSYMKRDKQTGSQDLSNPAPIMPALPTEPPLVLTLPAPRKDHDKIRADNHETSRTLNGTTD
ncbi:hypothetical protein FRB91_011701 [Serendipita sp. 411]|nr:hypothetical protein FRB91_011701 [Serendipita sp. 411]